MIGNKKLMIEIKEERLEEKARIKATFHSLSNFEKIELLSFFIDELKKSNTQDFILQKDEARIPIGVFATDHLSSLEAIVKYLKEVLNLKFSKIAVLLKRSNKTIWATYSNARKKMPASFADISTEIMIPSSIVADRSFSTLEGIVAFVKDLGHTNHEVALMLRLDDRTIWSVYDRVKKKRKNGR